LKTLADVDDYLHKPTSHRDWRESFYFNWVDLKSHVSGFSTIGVLPNTPKREFVLALFVDDSPEFYFAEPKDPVPEGFGDALSNGTLSYELVKPFTDWRIRFKNPRLAADIQWHQRFPVYDFGRGSGTSWARHLEQSGQVSGRLTFADGHTRAFRGFGQRDKSWGVRNWHIDEWFALHAQFDDFMIGLRHDVIEGKGHLSGCVSTAKENTPLVEIKVETEFEEGAIRKPVRALTHLRDAKGGEYTLRSRLIAPLTFARYARQFVAGETELFEEMVIHESEELGQTATGLAEWLFTHT
jgi:hypothetical protein